MRVSRTGIILFGIVLLGLALRMTDAIHFWNNGDVILEKLDAIEHLRRATILYHSFPWIPAKDYYTGFPAGTEALWSPLFDYIIVLGSFLTGATIPQSAFFVHPMFAVINILLAYLVGKKAWNKSAGILSALVLALLSVDIDISSVGDCDQHIAELTIWFSLILSLLSARRTGFKGIYPIALVLCLSPLVWRGATLMWGIAWLSVAVFRVIKKDCTPLRNFATASLTTSLFLAFCCSTGFMGAFSGIRFNVVSWFQVIIMAGMALTGFILTSSRKTAIITSVCAVITGIPALFALKTELVKSLAMVGGSNAWLDSIAGYSKLQLSFDTLVYQPTILYLLMPVALYVIWKNSEDKYFPITTSILFLALWVLALTRGRYQMWLPVPLSLTAGIVLSEMIKRKFWTGIVYLSLPFVIMLAMFVNSKSTITPAKSSFYATRNALVWLKNNSPATAGWEAGSTPEYSVMSWWWSSSVITQVAKRASVGTCYGFEAPGLYDSSLFFATSDAGVALDILKRDKSRYILLSEASDVVGSYNSTVKIVKEEQQKSGINNPTGIDTYETSIAHRLVKGDSVLPVKMIYKNSGVMIFSLD